jgi:peptidoglycan/xylan/chitin deacetylase (PgdA/CDA1 family)
MPFESSAKAMTNPPLQPSLQPPTHPWWRRAIVSGSHHAGLLKLAQHVAGRWDLNPNARFALRKAPQPKLAILCYHRIGTNGVPLYSALPPKVFEAQMRYLRRRYRLLSLRQLCEELAEPRTLDPGIAITFDDGYGDLFHQAFPILEKWNIPATIFLAVGAIDSGEVPWYDRILVIVYLIRSETLELEWDVRRVFQLSSAADRLRVGGEIVRILRGLPEDQRRERVAELEALVTIPKEALLGRMLSWEQIGKMCSAGISFGSHTISHRVIARLSPDEVRHELRESKRVIETHLGTTVDAFAFPFGQPSDTRLPKGISLAGCGYSCGLTTIEGTNAPGTNPYELRRTQIGEERFLPAFAWKLSELFLRGAGAQSYATLRVRPSNRTSDATVLHA